MFHHPQTGAQYGIARLTEILVEPRWLKTLYDKTHHLQKLLIKVYQCLRPLRPCHLVTTIFIEASLSRTRLTKGAVTHLVHYVDASPGLIPVSTGVNTDSKTGASRREVRLEIDRPGEYLLPVSVLQYFHQYPSSFDLIRFRHGMRLSDHFFNICVGGQVQRTCVRDWLKGWLHWRGCNAAACW